MNWRNKQNKENPPHTGCILMKQKTRERQREREREREVKMNLAPMPLVRAKGRKIIKGEREKERKMMN